MNYLEESMRQVTEQFEFRNYRSNLSALEHHIKKVKGQMKIARSISRKIRHGRHLERLEVARAQLILSRE